MNFNVLMENYDRVKELTEESADSAGTADQKYEAYMDSMEAATKRVENAWESFTMKLESSKVLRVTSTAIANIVENMDKLVPLVTTLLVSLNSSKIIGFFSGGLDGKGSGFSGIMNKLTGRSWNLQKDKDTGRILYQGTARDSWLGKIYTGVQQIEKNTGVVAQKEDGSAGGTDGVGRIWDRKYYRGQRSKYKKYKWEKKNEDIFGAPKSMTEQEAAEFKQYRSALTKQKLTSGGMAAGVAVAARLLQNKQVGDSSSMFGLMGLINKTGQTVEEDSTDKAIGVTLTGVGAGVGAAIGGPLGGMIGQFLGDGVSDIISYFRHRDELEMKQMVQEAKERLSVLNNIQDTLKTNTSLMEKEVLESDDYKDLEKYFDSLKEYMNDYREKGGDQSKFISNVIDDAIKISSTNGDISNSIRETYGSVNNIYDLVDKLRGDTSDIRGYLQRSLMVEAEETKLEKYEKSKEEEKNRIKELEEDKKFNFVRSEYRKEYSALKKEDVLSFHEGIKNPISFSGTLEEKLNKVEDIISEEESLLTYNEFWDQDLKKLENGVYKIKSEDNLSALKNYKKELEKALNQQKEIEEYRTKSKVKTGFLGADIYDLSQYDISDLGMAGLSRRIAEYIGEDARDETTGLIKEEYQKQIENILKQDSRFWSPLSSGDTRSISTLVGAGSDLKNKTGYEWSDLNNLLSTGNISAFNAIADELKIDPVRLEKMVYAADPQKITDFANAWNLTEEAAKKLADTIPGLTTALGMMSQSEVKEYFEGLKNVLEDLNKDSILTAENLEKVLKKYPRLINYIGDSGQMYKEILKMINEEQVAATANAFYSSFMVDEGSFKEFRDSLDYDVAQSFKTISTFQEAIDWINSGKLSDESAISKLEEYMDKEVSFEFSNPAVDAAIEFKTNQLEKQANSLQEQLSALDKINEQHKKELDWLKAKDNLENAKKNKARVYRAGVGWIAEANDDEVQKAKEELDRADIEKQKEALQSQIDSINIQKEILNNLEKNKNLESIEKNISDFVSTHGSWESGISELVDAFQGQSITFNLLTGESTYTVLGKDGKFTSSSVEIGGYENSVTTNESQLSGGEKVIHDVFEFGVGLLNTIFPNGILSSLGKRASGATDFPGGSSLINELGTEAIITPQGTVTALPSHTGIVPADITKNLWSLGEVAPTLIAQLKSFNFGNLKSNIGNNTYEEGQYIDHLVMNVYPTKDYDMDKLLMEARAKARLSRNNQ